MAPDAPQGGALRRWLPVAAITLAGLALRLHNLSFESLDIDEADVYAFAREDWPALLARLTQPGENGPLYVILLRLWSDFAGGSETALRLFSALPAVASLPLVYLLGRRLAGEQSGVLAALLLAFSTYHLAFAQMVKMYALVVLLSLGATLLLLEGLTRPRWRTWLAYAAVTTVAMYTHIFGAMLVPWHGLVVLLNLRRGAALPAAAAFALLTVPYLPLAVLRLAALGAPETLSRQFTGPRDLPGMFATLAREYGTRYDLAPLELLAAGFLGLTFLGAVAVIRNPAPQGVTARLSAVLLGTGLAVPLGITYGFVTLGAPVFSSRYLIVVLPVFYLLWGVGIAWVARAWSGALAVALVLGFVGVNGVRWSETALGGKHFREDWRGAVARLLPQLRPGDQVVVLRDPPWRAVHYYAGEGLPLYSLEGGPDRPPDLTRLPPAVPAGSRTWLVAAWFEAGDLQAVEDRLSQLGRLESKDWEHGVMLAAFRSP